MTTPFLESPRLPDEIAFWAQGGPNYRTSIITVNSGHEQRIQTWQYGLGSWNIIEALRLPDGGASTYNLRVLRDFYRVVKGQTYGFRMKDYMDFSDDGYGVLTADGEGTGYPAMQMFKNYVSGTLTDQRIITKPTGIINIYRNGSLCTYGSGAGQVSINTTNGFVFFQPDFTRSISAISQANPGVVTATAHGLTTGEIVLLTNILGMTQLNGGLYTVTVIDGNNFNIGVNTTSMSAYTSAGTVGFYPQPGEDMTWTGEFDVPVRFGTDTPLIGMGDGGLYSWTTIPIVELRV